VISDATNKVTEIKTVGSYPHGVAFDPNKREAFVAIESSDTVSVVSG